MARRALPLPGLAAGLVACFAAALPNSSAAQEGGLSTADALWDQFAAECGAVIDRSIGAVLLASVEDDSAGAQTSDGALATISRGFDATDTVLNAWIMTANGGRTISCAVTYVGENPGVSDGIPDAAAAGVEALLGGTATAYGGPVVVAGEAVKMQAWTLAGFPPPKSLTVLNTDRVTVLTLTRTILPEDFTE